MIEKNINEVLVKQEPSAKALLTALYEIDKVENFNKAAVYHNFPIYPDIDGNKTIAANVIFISAKHGIFIFQCVEYSNRIKIESRNIAEKLNEIDRILFAKILKDSPSLQLNRRALKVEITPTIFFNNCDVLPNDEDLTVFKLICNVAQLKQLIVGVDEYCLTDKEFRELKATIEGSKGIPRISDRQIKDVDDFKNSKGAVLSAIENEIYNFDTEQKRAALFIVDGAQRIRGLAGSGKTIILAMKAAIIHLQFPEAEILYTYYTKSLNDLIKRLITRFYRQFAERDPNWEKIHILHAWGGKYLAGVYSSACDYNNMPIISFSQAKINRSSNPFDYICEQLNQNRLKIQYDYALLDEAQDFPKNFYRICRQITQKNRIIWAYDDFQNILHIDMQNEKETFGKDIDGNWLIDFSRKNDELQDMILHRCYRNPRKILISAFALGLGIYNKNNKNKFQIIQRLESNEHWESLGFEVKNGDSSNGSTMIISRPEENSSFIKNELLHNDNLIKVQRLDTFREELDFIVNSIIDDIGKELKPEDISVVCMDNKNVKKYFDYISSALESKNIKTFNLLNVSYSNTLFKVKDHVTLSTIFNAKGNEAGSIYIVGIDHVFSEKEDITERNKIFTAMTRSLAWVTLTGVGDSVNYCIKELEELNRNNYELKFIQPSEKEVKTIRQGIDKKQKLLNKIERMADELSEEADLTREEIIEQLKAKMLKKQ